MTRNQFKVKVLFISFPYREPWCSRDILSRAGCECERFGPRKALKLAHLPSFEAVIVSDKYVRTFGRCSHSQLHPLDVFLTELRKRVGNSVYIALHITGGKAGVCELLEENPERFPQINYFFQGPIQAEIIDLLAEK